MLILQVFYFLISWPRVLGRGSAVKQGEQASHGLVCHPFSWMEWEDRRLFPSHLVPLELLRTEEICLLSPVEPGGEHRPGDSKLHFVFSCFHSRSHTALWMAL